MFARLRKLATTVVEPVQGIRRIFLGAPLPIPPPKRPLNVCSSSLQAVYKRMHQTGSHAKHDETFFADWKKYSQATAEFPVVRTEQQYKAALYHARAMHKLSCYASAHSPRLKQQPAMKAVFDEKQGVFALRHELTARLQNAFLHGLIYWKKYYAVLQRPALVGEYDLLQPKQDSYAQQALAIGSSIEFLDTQLKRWAIRMLLHSAMPIVVVATRGLLAEEAIKKANAERRYSILLATEADKHSLATRLAQEVVVISKDADIHEIASVICNLYPTLTKKIFTGDGVFSKRPDFINMCLEKSKLLDVMGPDAKSMDIFNNKAETSAIAKSLGISVATHTVAEQSQQVAAHGFIGSDGAIILSAGYVDASANLSAEMEVELNKHASRILEYAHTQGYRYSLTMIFNFDALANKFYFLECNTAMRASDPVTGVSIIELMYCVASNEKLHTHLKNLFPERDRLMLPVSMQGMVNLLREKSAVNKTYLSTPVEATAQPGMTASLSMSA